MHEYDKTSKWLIQHFGASILRIAGVDDLVSWRPLQAEVVQPRQLPDGLIEATRAGQSEPDLFVLELATYPDARVIEQAVRDTLLVYLDRRVLPEVVVLVLHPKGNLGVAESCELRSRLGWTGLRMDWRVVNLWDVPAEQLLATGDLGTVPWVPLTKFDGPAGPVLEECRRRIDRQAPPEQRENLLAVIQVLVGLRYDDQALTAIFGGESAMIESPVLLRFMAKRRHNDILVALVSRFGPAPADIESALRAIIDEDRLDNLMERAAYCPDLDAFRRDLTP